MIYEEYDRKLVRFFVDHHNQHLYPRIQNQTCLNRWWNGIPGGEPCRIEDEHQRVVSQTPERYELGKALLVSEGVNETEGVDRLLIGEVEATDASTIRSIDPEIISVPSQEEVNQSREEDRSAIIEKLKQLTTPSQRMIQPALLVVSNSDSINDDDW